MAKPKGSTKARLVRADKGGFYKVRVLPSSSAAWDLFLKDEDIFTDRDELHAISGYVIWTQKAGDQPHYRFFDKDWEHGELT